ncbi:MAG: type II toxin-antitoxin system PemK/MazF family toxin [Acidobacteriota bacterium]
MQRGDIWWATLPPAIDSGPSGRRPVVVIQDDEFIRSRIRTVIVVIVTSNLRLAQSPGNVHLPGILCGLDRDSVANISQLYTIDKSRLTDYVATLPGSLMNKIEEGLKLIMGL